MPVRKDEKTEVYPSTTHAGFIAEEMLQHFPDAVILDGEGKPHSIDLMAVVALLTRAVQELGAKG